MARKPRKGSRPAVSQRRQVVKSIAGLTVLLVLVIGAAFLAHRFFPPPRSVEAPPPAKPRPLAVKPRMAPAAKPHYEIYPKVEPPNENAPLPMIKKERTHPARPLVAIIIDDLGYDLKIARQFIQLNIPLTFALLPDMPHLNRIAQDAHAGGHQLMLHQPMEPVEYPGINPGPGALLTTMSPNQLIDQLNRNLDSIPYVRGVNNHMGSRMTTISTQMYQIFSVLKKRHLYFIDSRTTAESLCKPSARLLQVPFAQRDVFLDHIQTREFVEQQLKVLRQIADERHYAIAIGHPYRETLNVLSEQAQFLKKEFQIVPASELAHTLG